MKSWIKILVTDRQANVKNAGIYSEYFYPERGDSPGMSYIPNTFHHGRRNARNKYSPGQ